MVQSAMDIIDESNEDAIGNLKDQNVPEKEAPIQGKKQPEGRNNNVDFESSGISDMRPNIGDKIEVYWPLDNEFYPSTGEEQLNDGKLSVACDDWDKEVLDFSTETRKHQMYNYRTNLKVESIEQEILKQMEAHFGNKQFMR